MFAIIHVYIQEKEKRKIKGNEIISGVLNLHDRQDEKIQVANRLDYKDSPTEL